MTTAHCTGSCAQGRQPCVCPTGRATAGPRAIPTRPSLLQRLRRAYARWDLTSRLAGMEADEEELRASIDDLRAVQFTGSASAALLAQQRIVGLGAQLDENRAHALRLRHALALLDEGLLP